MTAAVLGRGLNGVVLLRLAEAGVATSTEERAQLFSRVYLLAERLGVLSCPNFDERSLDSMVEDDSLLRSIINEAKDLQI